MNRSTKRLTKFAELGPGWFYGEGIAIPVPVLELAKTIDAFAEELGLHERDAFPSTDGAVEVTIYDGDDNWQFIVEPDMRICWVFLPGPGRKAIDGDYLSLEQTKELMRTIGKDTP